MSRISSGIATSGSSLTSWRMSSIGKSGARSSGPTGRPVPGCSTGCGGLGMSARMLYQRRGSCDSSSRNFVCSTFVCATAGGYASAVWIARASVGKQRHREALVAAEQHGPDHRVGPEALADLVERGVECDAVVTVQGQDELDGAVVIEVGHRDPDECDAVALDHRHRRGEELPC